MVKLLEMVGRPEDARLPGRHGAQPALHDGLQRARGPHPARSYDWQDREQLDEAYRQVARALRPWTIDFHVAQNDGTVKGSGSHDKSNT